MKCVQCRKIESLASEHDDVVDYSFIPQNSKTRCIAWHLADNRERIELVLEQLSEIGVEYPRRSLDKNGLTLYWPGLGSLVMI